ncbi:MAG: non-canonical purine NTP pyrophosphatase, partial [Syntrophomonadaceae bacterium]|nr:non-canonical purine NTP pyrophosphatase [Syntrophomonadaceae bacterium]
MVATRNPGKLREISNFLKDLPLEIISLLDFREIPDIAETGATFEENAVLKAQTVARHSGELTLADDSGLEVDYLEGAPGVYSARFAGEPASDDRNNQKLLELMKDAPPERRSARFRCVMALA